MKSVIPVVLAVLLLQAGRASAFSLDFASFSLGSSVPNAPGSVTLTVGGYGDVRLSGVVGSALEIAGFGAAQGVDFVNGETLQVSFLSDVPGATPTLTTSGVDGGESFTINPVSSGVYEVIFTGSEAGLTGVQFLPEPSVALLGGMGLLVLLVRRR